MDEHYVNQIINGLGGTKALMDEMDEYHEIVARMGKEGPGLVEKYPNQWVVMGREGLLAAGNSMDEVIGEVERQELHGADVVIEFMDPDPPLLILRSSAIAGGRP